MCCFSADAIESFFLLVMTGMCCFLVFVDLKILEKMFEEYFLLRHYLSKDTFLNCYKPQSEMRMIYECYTIYLASICTVLTAALAFHLKES